jgi:hypothetical protein
MPLAGARFQKGALARLTTLPFGAPLRLVREDTNRYDPLAVAVWWGNAKLGYLPKAQNMEVAWAIAAKRGVRAVFAGRDAEGIGQVQIRWE